MKKIIMLLSAMLVLTAPAYAKTGDIAGKIYSTDILTYVNGKPAEGYNIGGKTAVILEDLSDRGYLGVNCSYDDDKRLLTVTGNWYKNYLSGADLEIKRGKPGKVTGNIYETDIRVILNGKEVKGYNLGGKTAVLIEDIGTVTDNPNADFGYSEYLCNFEWDGENRTVKLNFIDGYAIEYNTNPLAITVPCVNITARDNVLVPDYDPLNDFFSNIYSSELSEEFLSAPYTIKPMYFEIDQKQYDIGMCYVTKEGYLREFIRSPEYADSVLMPLVKEPVSCSDALTMFDDKTMYETLDSLETEDFFFLAVLDKNAGTESNDVYYITVKKTGGYAKINESSTIYTQRILEKVDVNKVQVTVSPFGGPHGATSMRMEFDLNNYIFW